MDDDITDFEREFGIAIDELDEKELIEFDKHKQSKRMQDDPEFRLKMEEYERVYEERQKEKVKKKQALTEYQERKRRINELYLEISKLKADYKQRCSEIRTELAVLKSKNKKFDSSKA